MFQLLSWLDMYNALILKMQSWPMSVKEKACYLSAKKSDTGGGV